MKWQDLLSNSELEEASREEQPDWVEPMLATLTHDHFDQEEWIYERKLDGQRCLIFKKGERVRLYSRNHLPQEEKYPELVEALSGQEHDFVADGEIVAFQKGVTSFSKLQPRIHASKPNLDIPVYLYLFDLMYLAGRKLTSLPLRTRKRLLKQCLDFQTPLRFTPHRNENGLDFLKEACAKGWEGLIAKDSNSSYVHSRSKKWLKFKCENRQEFVIGGYTAPKGERVGFGALLLGFHQDDKLLYAGKVGTGFNHRMLSELHEKMKQIPRDESPFQDFSRRSDEIHWIQPELVGEVSFTEWTGDHKLRHPSFQGLRQDKNPKEVVRE